MSGQYVLLSGAEPFYFEGNEVGILVSHGFTGSTQSMRPLGEAFADAGYTVCGPRLKGHGTHYEDMENTTHQDWITSMEEGYKWLDERCDAIIVVGLSMGGTLSLYMAEKHPEVKAIALINPAIEIPSMTAAPNQTETRFLDAIGSDIKKDGVQELAYEKTPVKSIKELVTLMDKVKADLSAVTCPTLIFVSKEDHVVPPNNTQVIYDAIHAHEKNIHPLENSYHVATLDHDQQHIINKTLEFIKQNS
jgi:carboxylesterase